MPKKKEVELADVLEAIKGLNKRIDDLENKKEVVEAPQETTNNTGVQEVGETTKSSQQYPVPPEYIRSLNEILCEEFGISIDPDPTRPGFTLIISVPRQFSNAGDDVWNTMKADIRSQFITYGEGLLAVKTFLEKIKTNLGPDIGAKIEASKK